MLSLMRKHAGSWIIKTLLGAVILAFIPFGYGIYRDRSNLEVASINGESITMEEYQQAYNNIMAQMRQRFGNSLNDEMIQMLQVKRQALDQLISQKLMIMAAADLELKVSDQELAEAIRNIAAFQTDGVFDSRRYQYILNRNRLSEEMFESQQRQAMLVAKLQDIVTDNIKVSDMEAEKWYAWYHAAVDVDYVSFPPNRYQNISPTKDEVETYFKNRQADYKTDEQIKTRYLRFNPDAYQSRIEIDEEEIKEYFEANPEEFQKEKTVEARHILFKVAENDPPEKAAEAKQKALDILKLARAGRDFGELAREFSEGPSKDRGGHLGTFKKDAMVQPFADKAFAMTAGEISEPVRTRFGWHVIKVEKVNEAASTAYLDAKDEIRSKLIEDQTKAMAYDDAVDVYDASFEGDDLIRTADDRGLSVNTTAFFTRSGILKDFEDPAPFITAAFNLADNEISDVLDLKDGYYIVQVVDRIPSKIPDLNDVYDRVKEDVIKEMQNEKAKADADAFIVEINNGNSFEKTCVQFAVDPKNTGFFKRNAPVPDIGYERQYIEASFKLSQNAPFVDQPVKGQKGYYVIHFRARKEPSNTDFLKEKEAVKQRLLQQKQYQTIDAWVAELRSSSEVVIQNEFLEQ